MREPNAAVIIREPSSDGSLMGLRCETDGTLVYFHAKIADCVISSAFTACEAIGRTVIAPDVLERIKTRYNLVNNKPASAQKTDGGMGEQLWEPCQRCGSEPSYARGNGHLCAACVAAGRDHPRIPGPRVPWHSTEPDNA